MPPPAARASPAGPAPAGPPSPAQPLAEQSSLSDEEPASELFLSCNEDDEHSAGCDSADEPEAAEARVPVAGVSSVTKIPRKPRGLMVNLIYHFSCHCSACLQLLCHFLLIG